MNRQYTQTTHTFVWILILEEIVNILTMWFSYPPSSSHNLESPFILLSFPGKQIGETSFPNQKDE